MSRSLLALAAFVASTVATFNIDSTPNAVGICYSVWHSLGYSGTPPPDITDIQHGIGSFAPQPAWHFWGRPAGGYYGGGDRTVLDRHFSQISGAGIEFIVIDATNLVVRQRSFELLLDYHNLIRIRDMEGTEWACLPSLRTFSSTKCRFRDLLASQRECTWTFPVIYELKLN